MFLWFLELPQSIYFLSQELFLSRVFLASEARKAVGLLLSLAIPQLRVSVYDVTIRNTYRDPESCHRPTCGTTISLNVRDNNITQRADDFRSDGFL